MGAFEMLKEKIGGLSVDAEKMASFTEKKFLFKPTGEEAFYLEGTSTGFELKKGETDASVTISGGSDVLSDVITGKQDAVGAFLSGKIKVSGDVMLAQKMVSVLTKS